MRNKKALVSRKTTGLVKSFEHNDFKPFLVKNQLFCSFCKCNLIDDSITFRRISACADCLEKFIIFDKNLREYYAKTRGRK